MGQWKIISRDLGSSVYSLGLKVLIEGFGMFMILGFRLASKKSIRVISGYYSRCRRLLQCL